MSRHLSDEQRDQIGAKLVNMQAGGAGGASPHNAGAPAIGVSAAAALVHSTPARIERARTIERADPKLARNVREVILAALRGRARAMAERAAVLGAALRG